MQRSDTEVWVMQKWGSDAEVGVRYRSVGQMQKWGSDTEVWVRSEVGVWCRSGGQMPKWGYWCIKWGYAEVGVREVWVRCRSGGSDAEVGVRWSSREVRVRCRSGGLTPVPTSIIWGCCRLCCTTWNGGPKVDLAPISKRFIPTRSPKHPTRINDKDSLVVYILGGSLLLPGGHLWHFPEPGMGGRVRCNQFLHRVDPTATPSILPHRPSNHLPAIPRSRSFSHRPILPVDRSDLFFHVGKHPLESPEGLSTRIG